MADAVPPRPPDLKLDELDPPLPAIESLTVLLNTVFKLEFRYTPAAVPPGFPEASPAFVPIAPYISRMVLFSIKLLFAPVSRYIPFCQLEIMQFLIVVLYWFEYTPYFMSAAFPLSEKSPSIV